ncbi:CheR family methyltransferase [Acetobacterium wieringae]|uniref:Chemotaxis protein methyltransferase cher2 n=1 Tax=Acetobacterium wieringae TaxID=52694 RepID=A0A1F2PIE1_9FIRM|nr:protein-glutamate O-methyltransferase CheR [Acetobacterium wieringae]OFV71090.1 chemotaxis protein methyltransferase cher2 [Acetobacterium wieringae]
MGIQANKTIFELIRIMKEIYKKDLTIYDDAFLIKSLERRMAGIKLSAAEYPLYLQQNRLEADLLMASFQITYSQFFRNALTFAVLEKLILPQLFSQKPENGEIRVWSADCSTGQEAYSIGILLEEGIKSVSKPRRFRIFATDLSSEALSVARTGLYDGDDIANIRMKQLKNYFEKQGDAYAIGSELKEKIDFSEYDLLDSHSSNPPDSIFGDFDIIFCCNLLFYYSTDVRRSIIRKLKRSLAKGGYLVTGEAESIFMAKDQDLKMLSSSVPIFQISR